MSTAKRLLTLVALMLGVGNGHGHQAAAIDPDAELTAQQLTEHVYVVHGPQAFPSPKTRGFMNNPGFVVTKDGVVLIDPGSSVQIGNKVLGVIRSVSDKPVIAVFNTHIHGDHRLGNQAIRQAYPRVPIYAHRRMIERVAMAEGEDWIELFNRLTGGRQRALSSFHRRSDSAGERPSRSVAPLSASITRARRTAIPTS